jgi:hypothetical protein
MKKWFILALVACVAATVQAEAEKKNDDAKGKPKVTTKESYVAWRKKEAEKAGKEFDQAAAEAHFDKRDKNGDGQLTGDEKKGKKKGKKKSEAA